MGIRSEYWIHDNDITYCDGSIGEENHESVALAHLRSIVLSHLSGLFKNMNRFENDWDLFTEKLGEKYSPIKFKKILKERGVTEDLWLAADDVTDAREYMIEKFGWKTAHGMGNSVYISTWGFSKKDIESIVNGVEEMLDSEGDVELEDNSIDINLYIGKNNTRVDYTLEELKQLLLPQINPIQQHFQQINKDKGNYLQNAKNIATQQIRDIEIDKLHPAYKRPGVNPLGDSVISFKVWLHE